MNLAVMMKVVALEGLLATIQSDPALHFQATELRPHLTDAEYEEYIRELRRNREEKKSDVELLLSSEALDYWTEFKDLYHRATLIQGLRETARLLDDAAELSETFEQLAPADRYFFRPAQAGEKWSKMQHALEYDFEILKSSTDLYSWLDALENHTQKQFLADLIERLEPSKPVTKKPGQRAPWFREYIKRNAR
ncbi:hypothetical protein [Methylobacterium sp. 37f]|uniref:hypothetical protein n=1 Tax=Methylobacterium sp. 37f TaxID=2817058 RepID=UPI001FFC84B4|nr:hypothetical protein [Methylobacterium sp. 37f]MCK2054772.1 hypothetical protein [Methylobacterium sp. 37f]